MKLAYVSLFICAALAGYAALRRFRARVEQSPEPQIPHYTYTTDRTYDEKKAVASARAARTHTPSGRPLRRPRRVVAKVAKVFSMEGRKRAR